MSTYQHRLIVCSVSTEDLIDDCLGVQQRSYSALISEVMFDRVGMFGNSNPLVISQWLEVFIVNETAIDETSVWLCLSGFNII